MHSSKAAPRCSPAACPCPCTSSSPIGARRGARRARTQRVQPVHELRVELHQLLNHLQPTGDACSGQHSCRRASYDVEGTHHQLWDTACGGREQSPTVAILQAGACKCTTPCLKCAGVEHICTSRFGLITPYHTDTPVTPLHWPPSWQTVCCSGLTAWRAPWQCPAAAPPSPSAPGSPAVRIVTPNHNFACVPACPRLMLL